jgi:hypothetical protein
MPEKRTLERAKKAKAGGKSPTTQAGEFVREEIHHVREGKHGARSPKQAVAIGLSKARRSGVKLPPPPAERTSEETHRGAERALEVGQGRAPRRRATPKRRRASRQALEREPRAGASRKAMSKQGRSAAERRSPSERSAASRKAARTKGPRERSAAAKKAARTRRGRSGRSSRSRAQA